jgi:Zn-dependent M28 family amino/carboxypeptidase
MHPEVADRLFCGAEHVLEEIHQMERTHTVRSFPLASQLRFRGSFRQRDFFCRNVVGLLPGADRELRDTYVLVSAHYDHLGLGPPVDGDAIYNGVIDNAIGVAGALEMARVLAATPDPPARSVVFLFPTAEEEGLLGSLHYLDHPRVPVHRTVANLNVDGLAHVDTFADVVGIGSEKSTLGETLQRVATRRGLGVSSLPPLARADPFTFSDQAAFAEVGVPALLVNEGLQWSHHTEAEALARYAEWGRTRYHRPSDDLAQPLNFEASREHVELLVDLVLEIANDPEPPRWHPGQPEALAQLRTAAEGR